MEARETVSYGGTSIVLHGRGDGRIALRWREDGKWRTTTRLDLEEAKKWARVKARELDTARGGAVGDSGGEGAAGMAQEAGRKRGECSGAPLALGGGFEGVQGCRAAGRGGAVVHGAGRGRNGTGDDGKGRG